MDGDSSRGGVGDMELLAVGAASTMLESTLLMLESRWLLMLVELQCEKS